MNKKYIIGAIVVILVIVVASVASGKSEKGPIKFGFVGPLTGDVASIGTSALAAAQIAEEEINAAGGINGRKVELVAQDGMCNPKNAVSATQKLVEVDGVTVILGGMCSGESTAAIPVAAAKKVPMISSCSSAPALSGVSPYFFRSYPSDSFQGKFAAEYAYEKMGAKKVAVVYDLSDWGTGIKEVFVNRFTELGGTVVLQEGAASTVNDFRTIIQKVKASQPDLIYIPLYTEAEVLLTKQASELGITTKILGSETYSDPKAQKDSVSKNPILFTVPYIPNTDDFNKKIMAKSGGVEVPICSVQTYDNFMIFANAIKKVGTDSEKIIAELLKTNHDGLSGNIQFDEKHDLLKASYVVKKLQNGVVTDVK